MEGGKSGAGRALSGGGDAATVGVGVRSIPWAMARGHAKSSQEARVEREGAGSRDMDEGRVAMLRIDQQVALFRD